MLVSPLIQKQLHLTYRQRASVEALRIRGLEFVAEINRSYGSGAVFHKNLVDILRDYRMRQAEEMKALLTSSQRNAFAALCGKPLQKSLRERRALHWKGIGSKPQSAVNALTIARRCYLKKSALIPISPNY
jgi:hypothetical protein